MKAILLMLMLLPISMLAQKGNDVFGKFATAENAIIKGTSVARHYENQLEVTNLDANNTNNNAVVKFSIPIGNASAIFRDALNNKKKLRSGEITVKTHVDENNIIYIINLEDISVEACTDVNGITSLQLRATRICWTYFSRDRMGKMTSTKTGWDTRAEKPWTVL
jgi:type VI protein secretion system component Hcp